MMSFSDKLKDFFSVPTDNPSLLKAQHQAISRQMPMMYFILMANTWAVAITHIPTDAPLWLTVLIPGAFSAISIIRATQWLRNTNADPEPGIAHRELVQTNRLAIAIPVVLMAWSFALIPYGDAYAQSHVAFYMAITVIACIFCLMYLRSAALIVTALVNGAFIAFFASTGQPTFAAIAVNILLVCAGMLVILAINYENFSRLISAQRETQALSDENLRLANLDSLTEIPNRRAFFSELNTAINAARDTKTRLAVGVIDLDGFKPVNDLYGHSAGDRLLVGVAERLSAIGWKRGILFSRLGGDEFAFIIPQAPDDAGLAAHADAICSALAEPFDLTDAHAVVSASLGISVYPDTAETKEQLFDRADYALFHGKRAKRGCSTLFSTAHHEQIHRAARIEQTLKQADLDTELTVVFQPIVDTRSGTTSGFEALARWHSPLLGAVSPREFVPVAERAGIVSDLTRHLLDKALGIAETWPKDIRLSFNLSAHDLNTPEGIADVVGIIQKSGFPPSRLDIEITETAFAHDFDQMQRSIAMLRALGCGISLDDFGTGYSSLTQLHALPLTKIKIDRSFVTELHQKPPSYKIVKSLLALSIDMELDCVIEGVETAEELEAVTRLGGVLAQGYFYSPPIPASETLNFLSRVHASAKPHQADALPLLAG